MRRIGTGVAKRSRYVGAREADGTPVGRAWEFDSSRDGFAALDKRLRELGRGPGDASIVAMGATGSHWMSPYGHLADAGWMVAVVSPALVAAFREADTMRRTETDAIGCLLVAEHARSRRVRPSERDPEGEEGLKQSARHRSWLVRGRTAPKSKVADVVGRLLPEPPRPFGGWRRPARGDAPRC